MSDDYGPTFEDVSAQLDRIERRLDNMGQRIAYLEGYVMGVRKDPELSRPLSSDSAYQRHRRSMRIMFAICWSLIAFQVIFFVLIPLSKTLLR